MLLYDVHQLACEQVHLMGVLALIVTKDTILLQALHLIGVGDDRIQCCMCMCGGGGLD